MDVCRSYCLLIVFPVSIGPHELLMSESDAGSSVGVAGLVTFERNQLDGALVGVPGFA